MRTYPTDSPQAAARIVALTLVADGHVCKTEFDVLERVGAYGQLGLDHDEMQAVLQSFCEDLLQAQSSQWADACLVDPRTLSQLMAECRTRMPAYMVPAGIELVDGPLPRNPNGKIDR